MLFVFQQHSATDSLHYLNAYDLSFDLYGLFRGELHRAKIDTNDYSLLLYLACIWCIEMNLQLIKHSIWPVVSTHPR